MRLATTGVSPWYGRGERPPASHVSATGGSGAAVGLTPEAGGSAGPYHGLTPVVAARSSPRHHLFRRRSPSPTSPRSRTTSLSAGGSAGIAMGRAKRQALPLPIHGVYHVVDTIRS